MKLTYFNTEYKAPSDCVGVFGCFDGVHKGHAELIKQAVDFSRSHSLPVVVWMLNIPRDDMLSSEDEKKRRIAALGADAVISEDYSDIKDISPIDFLNRMKNKFGVCELFCGYNFTFGKDRQGNTQNLAGLCDVCGITSHVVPEYSLSRYGKKINVSSSGVRMALRQGDIPLASFILGRPVRYIGTVKQGAAIGRTLGFPTANIYPDKNLILPRYGVYAATLKCGRRLYPAITNIGTGPTFERSDVIIESYITSGEKNIDLYGKKITLTLLHFIRDEKRFSDPGQLTMQIQQDLIVCNEYHKNRRKYSE